MKKEEFKKFVRNHPELINYVKNNKMTWQQFYEIYDLYGEDNSIWNSFKDINESKNNNLTGTIKEFLNLFKGIDAKKVQSTLTSLSKAIEAFKNTDNNLNNLNNYDERPKYKYFED